MPTEVLNSKDVLPMDMTEDQSVPDDSTDPDPEREGGPEDGDGAVSAEEWAEMRSEEREHFGMVDRVFGVWDDVLTDMEATVERYREEGWEVLEIHPGDVASPDGDQGGRWGLDVLVPDDEFETLERLIEGGDFSFDESEVYRATGSGLVLLVVVMLDHDTEVAVFFPAYYDVDRAHSMLDRATDAGEMRTHLRPLDLETIVTFTHDDPSLFMPQASGDETDEA